jgi:hypothetical protein
VRRRIVTVFIAIAAFGLLLPGLVLGGLVVAFTPIRIHDFGLTWLEMKPLSYMVSQAAALLAWFRTPRLFARIPFLAWLIFSCVSAIVWIAEMRWQISEFDGPCGNIILGAYFMQFAAYGTIGGMFLLAVDDRI